MTHDPFPHPSHDASHDASEASHHPDPLADIDPAFVFDFQASDDVADDGQRWSTWLTVEPLCRGPEPRPDWVVTSQAAVDTDLGVLKTGKEADAFLLERAVPGSTAAGESVVMVAKRYRGEDERSFQRSAAYVEGRRVRNTRDARAMAKKTAHGRAMAAGQWAIAEWNALVNLWQRGLAVPYPVQVDGTELLMEWVTVEGEHGPETAPRLAQARPDRALLESYYEQTREALATLVEAGVVHGDLSPYNVLAAGDRLVVIDLPQVVDLVANVNAMDFLLRDCRNMCTWFRARGLEVDEHDLYAELLAHAF